MKEELRYVMAERVPEVGICCIGKETNQNGLTDPIVTDLVEKVKEIMPKKYLVTTENDQYLVNVV